MRALRFLGFVLVGTVAAAAPPQDEARSLKQLVDPFQPSIESVSPTCSYAPGVVTVVGENLDWVIEATVAGEPARILNQSTNELTLVPKPTDPGFDTLVVSNGLTTAQGSIELFPTLSARVVAPAPSYLMVPGTDGMAKLFGGDLIEVTLHEGVEAFFVLAASAGESTRPLNFQDPFAYYQLMLNRDHVILDYGFLMRPDFAATRRYEIPAGFHGRFFVQGLCTQLRSGAACYTNLGHVVIE